MTHDRCCAYLHYYLCTSLGIGRTEFGARAPTRPHKHTHTQKPICENEDVIVLSNQDVRIYKKRYGK